MKIRKITAQDTLAISRILHELEWFTWIQQETVEATQQRVARHLELCQQDDSHTIWVAENDQGEVVGYTAVHWLPYLMLKAPEGYVSELFVASAARGQGVGAQLLETVKAEAIKRGCLRLSLINVKIRESYQRGFYKKQGWTEREHDARFVLELMYSNPKLNVDCHCEALRSNPDEMASSKTPRHGTTPLGLL